MKEDELKVEVRKGDNYSVISTEGYINNLGGERIAEECYLLMDEGVKHFILNLARTRVINSIGISILIEIIEKVLQIKGSISFCQLTPTIAKTFHIMGLAQYARIFDTEDEAIKVIGS
jgi:anti-anti-sigma factor